MSCSIYLCDLEVHQTRVTMPTLSFLHAVSEIIYFKIYCSIGKLERVFDRDLRLSDGKGSDQSREEDHGYLPMCILNDTGEDERACTTT